MVNVAVINIKSLIKILLILFVVIFFIYFVQGLSINLDKLAFSPFILNQTIPGIATSNNSNFSSIETSYIESKSPLQFLLNSQLPVMSSIKIATHESENNIAEEPTIVENNNTDNTIEHASTNIETQVIDSGVPNKYTNDYQGVEIKNGTNYTLTDDMKDMDKVNELLQPIIEGLEINQSDVMIFHTHTCESYTPTENFAYEESGTFRTTDLDYSVVRVGNSLTDQLTSYGFNVVHDKTYHDSPAYSGSYGRSMATVENLLISHPNTDIIIDLHRDAIADTSYAPSIKIGDEVVSQLMFVIGTDGGGLEHPNWQKNLQFAVKVQKKANELYPGLFRPILLRNSRYNQQLGKAACIIEVGATGNTLEQSMASMKYLARVFSSIFD